MANGKCSMTAAQIMREIDCLPPAEQEKVANYARKLPSTELTARAQRMVDATDPATAQRLKADLVKGFYG